MRFSVVAVLLLVASLAFALSQPIPDQYLVMLKPSTGLAAFKLHLANITSSSLWNPSSDYILARWAWEEYDFYGYSATLTSKNLVQLVADHPDVIAFENDQHVHLDACQTRGSLATGLWGLSRVSYRQRQSSFSYFYQDVGDGAGVDAYIIDTGIYTSHSDFGGRARIGFNAFPNESPQDLNGHGTHCAGTVAGTNMGIAKLANLISVKVLNAAGSGTNTGIINGIDWLISNLHPTRACVINMSLGGGYSAPLNTAVNRLVQAGCFTAVAAGNSNANACNFSPASASEVVSVMATTNADLRSSFSNFGTCCHIFAPGSNILSDWIGSTTATNTISGTSMASPHVCGVAASYLSLNPGATPAAVKSWMTGHASPNLIQSPGTGSPNLLLYQGCLTV